MTFFVGQKVYSPHFGNGSVVTVRDPEIQYPIVVAFDSDICSGDSYLAMFTSSGCYWAATNDPKMDISPLEYSERNKVEFPGPVSRFLFSTDYVTNRICLAWGSALFIIGGIIGALVFQ
jgi:hypothetical protein